MYFISTLPPYPSAAVRSCTLVLLELYAVTKEKMTHTKPLLDWHRPVWSVRLLYYAYEGITTDSFINFLLILNPLKEPCLVLREFCFLPTFSFSTG